MYSYQILPKGENVPVKGATKRGKCTRARYYRKGKMYSCQILPKGENIPVKGGTKKGKSARLGLSTYSYERRER